MESRLNAALVLLALGLTQLTPVAVADHTPTEARYLFGTLSCDPVLLCPTANLNQMCQLRNTFYPSTVPIGINGFCGLTIPSEPRFAITVEDYAGNPVEFFYGTYRPNGGSCAFSSAFGYIVVTLPDSCRGHEFVYPYFGAVFGTIRLSPVP